MFENTGFLSESQAVKERSLIRNVYMWMTAGLALTGVVSLWMMSNPARIVSLVQSGMFWGLIIGRVSACHVSFCKNYEHEPFCSYTFLCSIFASQRHNNVNNFSNVYRGKYCINLFHNCRNIRRDESLCSDN